MDYNERIQSKVEMVFQIVNEFLSERLTKEEAKNRIDIEMVNIRPAQYEAIKVELGKRLNDSSSSLKNEKLFDLFKNYLSLPYTKLENGHPLRNYYEENSRVRNYLLAIDQMEGAEVTLDDWRKIYESIKDFTIHIERQKNNFYPLMILVSMRLQVEKVKELGETVIEQIHKNLDRINNEDIIEFLINQRNFTQTVMDYLELEERVLFPKALSRLTNQEFKELRESDDRYGYSFIGVPNNFTPKEEKKEFDSEFILSSLLASKYSALIYYSLSGEPISIMGSQVRDADLAISEEIKEALLNETGMTKKYYYKEERKTFLVSYNLVLDSLGKPQGILKTKEDISEIQQKAILTI